MIAVSGSIDLESYSTEVASSPSTELPRAATRERIVTAAAELFRRNGYAGTGIKAILTASAAPYGSLYHYFPDGKQQLGVTVIESGGEVFRQLVEAIYDEHDDVVAATRAFFTGAADVLESTEFADACPIATIAGEIASTSEAMRDAAQQAFASWIDELSARLVDAGLEHAAAQALGVEAFCLIEGAFLLARTSRDAEPVRVAGRRAAASIEAALAGRR